MEKEFEPGILYTGEGKIALVFRRDGNWYTACFEAGFSEEERIIGLSGKAEIFFTDYNIKTGVGFLEQEDEKELLLYEFSTNTPVLKNRATISHNTDSVLILYDRETNAFQSIKSRLYGTSLNINGTLYFCVYDGRNVSLYRTTTENLKVIGIIDEIPLQKEAE
jgi:hypothetical protein